jgi:hypothetical protein
LESIPTIIPPGDLPEFSGVMPITVEAESTVSAMSLTVPSATPRRISLLAVNQGETDSTDGLS